MAEKSYYSYGYEHSYVFSVLRAVDEKIQKNWSTEQYLNALDTMLSHTVEPIIRSCGFMNHMVAGILAWHSDTSNNRITAHDKIESVHYMMAFLTRKDSDEKLKVFNRLKFDRNITLQVVEEWLKATADYRKLCEHYAATNDETDLPKIRLIEKAVLHDNKHHESLYAAIPCVKVWLNNVIALRTQIVEKYYRLILNEAKSFYDLMNHSIDLDDTIQSMYLEASKAIDKCNQERGTITSYMQRYLRFSRSRLGTEKDTAFSVPGRARNGDFSHKSFSLEDADLQVSTDEEDSRIETMHVRKLARLLDPKGVGRHSLGIEEYVPALIST